MKIVAKFWEYLSHWRIPKAPLQPPVMGDGAIYWVKPRQNEVKITVVAMIFEDKKVLGMKLIVRDHKSHLIIAKLKSFAKIMNPTWSKQLQ